jgi:hypothetical protein
MESEGPLVGKVEECDVKSRHLQGCSPPPVSIKDRWVAPPRASIERTDHMLVYGPNKLMQLCNHLAKTSLPYSKAVAREGE